MRNDRFAATAAEISTLLSQFPGMRPLTVGEVAMYGGHFQIGWEIAGFCAAANLQLRVLLPKAAPYFTARIAVWPGPPVLTWPHLEEHGLLCLLSEPANISIGAPGAVVLALLDDARKLVDASVLGDNVQDFEDEFTTYWERWPRTKTTVNLLCEPIARSRMLSAWQSTVGSFVAENETALRSWLTNRYGKETPMKIECWPVPLLWLRRPLRPLEYPVNVSKLRGALDEAPFNCSLLETALVRPEPESKLIVLGMPTRHGVSFAGIEIHEPPRLRNGFRERPRQDIMLTRYNAAATTGARVIRFDPSWVHGRDHNPDTATLQSKTVAIIGIGSLGSGVADLLAKAGIGKFMLFDPEVFASANSCRHLLGAPAVGSNKADAVATEIAARFPHVTITPMGSFTDDAQLVDSLRSTDLIISMTGNWQIESLLDAIWRNDEELRPVMYGWTEPHAIAGHALALMHQDGCLRCILDDMGKTRVSVTSWSLDTMVRVPACGDLFQPYGATALAFLHPLVADLALDVLLHRVNVSTHRVWIGTRRLLDYVGGAWNPAWIDAHGSPNNGGQLFDAPFKVICPNCRSAQ